jgi:hypothetical protein
VDLASFKAFTEAAKTLGVHKFSVDPINGILAVEFEVGNGQPAESIDVTPKPKIPSGTAELAELLNVPEDSNFHFPGAPKKDE